MQLLEKCELFGTTPSERPRELAHITSTADGKFTLSADFAGATACLKVHTLLHQGVRQTIVFATNEADAGRITLRPLQATAVNVEDVNDYYDALGTDPSAQRQLLSDLVARYKLGTDAKSAVDKQYMNNADFRSFVASSCGGDSKKCGAFSFARSENGKLIFDSHHFASPP